MNFIEDRLGDDAPDATWAMHAWHIVGASIFALSEGGPYVAVVFLGDVDDEVPVTWTLGARTTLDDANGALDMFLTEMAQARARVGERYPSVAMSAEQLAFVEAAATDAWPTLAAAKKAGGTQR